MNIILKEHFIINNNNKHFTECTKLDINHFLLLDEIKIEDKLNIFYNFLQWKYNCILLNVNYNLDMYPFFNLLLTYIYIKEKLIVTDIQDYLYYDVNNSINNITNKQILAGIVLSSFINQIYTKI